ncbi:MAG: hypothetical protein ACTMHL_05395 [Janibacter sp.]
MTVQQGMDSARIRQISGQLDAEVTRLGDVLAKGNASAGVLEGNWGGDDGQELLVRWRSDALKQITSATELLRSASKQLQREADQQDEASGESGGGSPGPVGPLEGGPARPGDVSWSTKDRDEDSTGVRTTTDSEGNTHHYDPVTGKSWVEGEDGTWKVEHDGGHRTRTDVDETDHGGRTTTHESSRGEGGGRKSYGEKWETEWTDEGREKSGQSVLDQVQTEPLVEQDLWDQQAHAEVWGDSWGDENLGASAEVLSANAETSGQAGVSLEDGAYVQANAEAGAYLAKGEAHWQNQHGTGAEGEAYIGAEATAEGQASIGPGGARIDAGLDAFAGGKAEGEVSQDIGDYGSVGVGGEVSYGIGAHAEVDGEISADRIGVSVDVGATLGIGAGVNFDVSVSPSEIIGDLGDAGQAVADSNLNPLNWG